MPKGKKSSAKIEPPLEPNFLARVVEALKNAFHEMGRMRLDDVEWKGNRKRRRSNPETRRAPNACSHFLR